MWFLCFSDRPSGGREQNWTLLCKVMDLDVSREEGIKQLLGNKGKHFLPRCRFTPFCHWKFISLLDKSACVWFNTFSSKRSRTVCISYFSLLHTAIIEASKIEECSACGRCFNIFPKWMNTWFCRLFLPDTNYNYSMYIHSGFNAPM